MAGFTQQTCKILLFKPESILFFKFRDINSLKNAADNGPKDDLTNIYASTSIVTISAKNL